MSKFVRFSANNQISYGTLDDAGQVQQLHGGLFDPPNPTGVVFPVASVQLLYPCQPTKILCVGLNYRSHLDGRPAPANPEIFYKPLSALQNPGGPIKTPLDSVNLHFEGELVAVMGPNNQVFGVTCGNDLSERDWQRGPNKDLQWWRAKGCDTFAPLGPAIVTGLDYANLRLNTILNGKVVQDQTTADLLFDIPAIVAYISKWVTLNPGDVVYTGTPGNTSKLNPGDLIEVEIEHIGKLSNPVV
jgi:2-keto-4-pentenoate hydratase/2-oxohepta-3-ene-1,7-dioic acid hydratase in catechol pathway